MSESSSRVTVDDEILLQKYMIEIFDTKRNDINLLNSWSKKRYCRCQSATTKFRTAVLQIESRAVFKVGNLYHLHVFELKNSRLTVPGNSSPPQNFCGNPVEEKKVIKNNLVFAKKTRPGTSPFFYVVLSSS